MNPTETNLLIGALVGLIVAVQGWIVSKTVTHSKQLDGELDTRIVQGAKAVVANDHALRAEQPSPAANSATQARIAALQAELETLQPPLAPVVPAAAPSLRR
jgi:hypothetical protein